MGVIAHFFLFCNRCDSLRFRQMIRIYLSINRRPFREIYRPWNSILDSEGSQSLSSENQRWMTREDGGGWLVLVGRTIQSKWNKCEFGWTVEWIEKRVRVFFYLLRRAEAPWITIQIHPPTTMNIDIDPSLGGGNSFASMTTNRGGLSAQ